MKKLTKQEFIEKSIIKNGDIYDFSNSIYTLNTENITVVCKNCNNGFTVMARFITEFGNVCPICQAKSLKIDKDLFLKKFYYKYPNNNLNFDNFVYNGYKLPSTINCPKHGGFQKSPALLLRGIHCKYCSYENMKNIRVNKNPVGGLNITVVERNKDFYKSSNCNLYIVKLFNDEEEFYKIGITSNTKNRFNRIPYKLLQLKIEITNFYDGFYRELKYHNMLKEFRYKPLNKFGGHTECFSVESVKIIQNILELTF